jgi:CheY-like chemotaxis protein
VNPVIKILFVEDVRTDAELEVRELRRAGLKVEHRLVETEQAFLSALSEFPPDIILSDFSMPQFDGMAALALARTACPLVPFVFVSGTLGEEYAIRALQQGASDYVPKAISYACPPPSRGPSGKPATVRRARPQRRNLPRHASAWRASSNPSMTWSGHGPPRNGALPTWDLPRSACMGANPRSSRPTPISGAK